MNIIEIAGNLGADPITRMTPKGTKVTTFSVGVRHKKDETVWYKVVIWGDRFDKMLVHLKKGSAIIVIGELTPPEIYTDKNGNQKINLEINAEMMRFSPFGKPDSNLQQVQKPIQNQASAFDGDMKGKAEEKFAEDPNLPF